MPKTYVFYVPSSIFMIFIILVLAVNIEIITDIKLGWASNENKHSCEHFLGVSPKSFGATIFQNVSIKAFTQATE